MADHDGPYVGEYDISGDRKNIEYDEQNEVEEEDYECEYGEGPSWVWIVMEEDGDRSGT